MSKFDFEGTLQITKGFSCQLIRHFWLGWLVSLKTCFEQLQRQFLNDQKYKKEREQLELFVRASEFVVSKRALYRKFKKEK